MALSEAAGAFPFSASGRDPFAIDDLRHCWLVKSGRIDLFVIKSNNGIQTGPRQFMASIFAGAVVFPMASMAAGDKTVMVQAVGNAEMIQLSFEVFRNGEQAGPDSLCRLVDQWIETVAAGIPRKLCPQQAIALVPGAAELKAMPGQLLCSQSREILWCRVNSGACMVSDEKYIHMLNTGSTVPLINGNWLEAVDEVSAVALSTSEILRTESWPTLLSGWHFLMLELYELSSIAIVDERKNRLCWKQDFEEKLDDDSCRDLAAVLTSPNDIINHHKNSRGKRPLEYAWTLVAESQGLPCSNAPFPADLSAEAALKTYAKDTGFKVRQITIPEQWWRKDSGPLIAFLDDREETPVALIPRSASSYVIVNAVTRESVEANADTAKHLRPYGYLLYRQFPRRRLKLLDIVTFAANGNRNNIVMTVAMGMAGAVMGLIIPICTGIIFSRIIPDARYDQLLQLGVIIFSGAIAGSIFQLTLSIAMIRLEERADYHLQSAVIDRMLSLPVTFFRRFSAGDLSTRCQGITDMRTMLSDSAATLVIGGVFSLFYLTALFFYSIKMALMAVSFSMIFVAILVLLAFLTARILAKEYNYRGIIAGTMLEQITGVEKIRLANAEKRVFNIYTKLLADYLAVHLKSRNFNTIQVSLNSVFPILSSIGFFYWIAAPDSGISMGNFIAFNAMYVAFVATIIPMSLSVISWTNIIPLYDRTRPIIETLPEISETKLDPGLLTGDLKVNNLCFRYSAEEQPILRNIDFSVKPGEFVAIVGSSGSGKSTLLRLLLGFEIPESGGIFYNNISLDRLDIRKMRRQIGVVLQNGQLFNGTVYENIVSGLDLSVEDAWRAAAAAGCDQDIREMPLQMQTMLSAGNGNISGGQKQRILIARSLIRNPRLIFFDEATSALDNQSQAIITRSLEQLKAARVIIAHRLNTIIGADRIYVMDKGVFVETGTFDELMKNNGMFAQIAQRQML